MSHEGSPPRPTVEGREGRPAERVDVPAARRPRPLARADGAPARAVGPRSAAQSGDLEVLTGLLAHDARVVSGGGKVPAALNVIVGNDRAARFLIGVSRKGLRDARARFALVNGLPGLIVEGADILIQTVAFEITEDDRIRAVYIVRNPEKLRHLSPATG
jgi:RNA polymerase sigma-70 factor (ECF subfamily)